MSARRALLVALVLANAADAVTFGLVTSPANLAGEANPIARALFASAGLAGVWAYKAVGVSVLVGAACRIARPRAAAAVLGLGVVISLAAAASNLVFAA